MRAITRRQASAVTSMCTDADCNFVISGDASKSGFHIWPMLHVCLFKRTKKKRIEKKKLV